MRRVLCVLSVFVALAGSPLPAQEPLSLEQVVALARERGPQAQAARATLEAGRYRDDAFLARQLPQVSLTGTVPTYNRSIIPVLQPDGSTLFRPQRQTNSALTMRMSQQLPFTGTELFVTSALARLSVVGQRETETWSATPVSFGLRQELFRPNAASWDRRERDIRTERDERAYLEALEDVAIQVTDLFFDLYAAQVALENAVKNSAVNDTLYRLNTGRYEVGRIGENDLLQSELAVLRAATTLDAARLTQQRAAAALRLAIGLPAGTPLEVTVPSHIPEVAVDTARAVAEALRNRAAVSDAELQELQADRRVAEARLGGGPGATVQASFGYNAVADDMGLAYQNLLEARQLSLSVQVPVWQWGARGATVRAAEAERVRGNILARSAMEQLAHDAHFGALQLEQAYRNVVLLAKADTVADRRFEVAYNRYVIGRIALDNLYTAQSERDQALTQFLQGLRNYWGAFYRLRRITLFDFVAGQPLR